MPSGPFDQALTAFANAGCTCLDNNNGFPPNNNSPFNNATLFPADYGKSCKAWDEVDCLAQW